MAQPSHVSPLHRFLNSSAGLSVRNMLLPSLFGAAAVSAWYIQTRTFELDSFPRRMIGLATAELVDVGSRAGVHWRTAALALAVFSVLVAVFRVTGFAGSARYQPERRIMAVTSVAGIVLVAFLPWQPVNWPAIIFLLALQSWLLLGGLLKRQLLPESYHTVTNEGFYVPLLLLSVSLGILVHALSVFFGGPSFILAGVITPFVLITPAIWWLKKQAMGISSKELSQKWMLLAWRLAPLVLTAGILRISAELFYDLNKLGLYKLQNLTIFLILSGLLALWIVKRFLWPRRKAVMRAASADSLLKYVFYPMALASVMLPLFLGIVAVWTNEMFENGNLFLPVSQYFEFGRIPILEILPAHLLSDFAGGFLHSALTGGPEHSDFLCMNAAVHFSIAATGFYVLSLFLFRHAHLAFLFVLLFPAAEEIIPTHYAAGGLGIGLIWVVLSQPPSLKRYLLLMAGITGLILWKLDIGYPVLLSMAVVFAADRFTAQKLKLDLPSFLKAGAMWLIMIAALVGIFSVLRGINPLHNLSLALHYFVSEQSYGYPDLGDPGKLEYRFQYLLFVGGVIIGLMMLLMRPAKNGAHITWVTLIYMSVFFLFNYQRGLVRHNLREEDEVMIHSYFFAIAGGLVYWLCYHRAVWVRWTAFSVTAGTLVLALKYPNAKISNAPPLFTFLHQETQGFSPPVATGLKLTRTQYPENEPRPQDSPIIQFLRTELSGKQTFIDFSNQPMLYYFAEKEVPSYFAQIPAMLHDDYLQDDFIEGLKNYDAPIVVYSGPSEKALVERMDGIQNAYRHYRIAEFIHNQYEPWANVDGNFIWKKKGYSPKFNLPATDRYNGVRYQDFYTGESAFAWAMWDDKLKENSERIPLKFEGITMPNERYKYNLPLTVDKSTGNYIVVSISSNLKAEGKASVLLDGGNGKALGGMTFTIPAGQITREYAFRVSAMLTWYYPGCKDIQIELPFREEFGESQVIQATLVKGD